MNEQDKQRKRNDTARLIDFRSKSGSHVNCIRINTNNTLEHEIAKLKKCYELIKEGKQVLTEAKFDNGGGIADIINLDDGYGIEIVHTETEDSLNLKRKKYPVFMEVVRCTQ